MKRTRPDRIDDASLARAWSLIGTFERHGSQASSFLPTQGTYRGVDGTRACITTVQDSGRARAVREAKAELSRFIAAALYEVAFCWEAGPLSTWRN